MKKLNLLLAIIIGTITFSCSTSENNDNKTESDKLDELSIWIADNNGNLPNDFSYKYNFQYSQDALASMTEQQVYMGNLYTSEEKVIYNNNEISQIDIYEQNVLKKSFFYNYPELNQTKITNSGDNSYELYSLENNNLKVIKSYSNGGALSMERTMVYDMSGNVEKITETSYFGSTPTTQIFQFTYDDKNSYHKSLDLNFKLKLYDGPFHWLSNNNILTSEKYINGELTQSYNYIYRYNSNFYPIERELRDMNNKLIELTTFKYE